MAKAATSPSEAARRAFHQLQAEQGSLPEQTEAAMRATDVERWMRLQNRAADLPGEIRAAELALLPLELEEAWSVVPALLEAEVVLATELASAQAELYALRTSPRLGLDIVAAADLGVTTAQVAERANHLERQHRSAQDAAGLALLAVDRIEGRLAELTGEGPADRDGPRAVPPPSGSNIVLSATSFGVLAVHLPEVGERSGYDGAVLLLAGSTPPRWVAHRLGTDYATLPRAAGEVTAEDIERARIRLEELGSLVVGMPTRLGPGAVPFNTGVTR